MTTKTDDDDLIERSDDDKRGAMPHIRRTLDELRDLKIARRPCTRCTTGRAEVLCGDGPATYRALCRACSVEWRKLSPLAKRQSRIDRSRR